MKIILMGLLLMKLTTRALWFAFLEMEEKKTTWVFPRNGIHNNQS